MTVVQKLEKFNIYEIGHPESLFPGRTRAATVSNPRMYSENKVAKLWTKGLRFRLSSNEAYGNE